MADRRPPRAAVRAAVRASLADLEPGERVIVALSGGADSLALTAAMVAVGADLGLLCEAVVIDHQLQPDSGEVAERAAEQARILGCLDARVIAVDVPQGSGSGGVEAAARGARYAALDAVAAEEPSAAAVLLGHTREDQAETVLLGLARGSGTRSLAGMAARAGVYRRPLLELPRDVVLAAAFEAATADPRLEPWTDPHNTDAGFARVRVRHEVLPVLEEALGPGIVEALARTATQAREDADALDAWAERVWAQALGRATHNTAAASDTPAPSAGTGSPGFGRSLPQEEQEPSKITEQAAGAATIAAQPGPDRVAQCGPHHRGGTPSPRDRAPRGPPVPDRGRLPRRLADGRSHPIRGRIARTWGLRASRSGPARRPTGPQGGRCPGCESLTLVDASDIGTDLEKVLLDEATLQARLREMAAQVDADYEGRDVLLVGVLKGAVMVMADLARAMSIHLQMDWMAVSSYGSSTKSSGVVRILKDLDTDITGRHVLIVEDIIDSGLTLSWLMRNLTARGAASVEVLTMLRKPEAVKVELEPKYIGFDIPNEFVVGYGLDYAEKYRNLREIGTLAPHVYS